MYLSSTSSTHGHLSPYLRPGTWVLANGSKMICQPLGHLLGPGSSHTGLGIWAFSMSDLIFMYLVLKKKKSTKTTPSDRVPYSGRAPKILLGAQIIHEDKKFSLKNKNKNPYTQENFGNKIQKWQMEM